MGVGCVGTTTVLLITALLISSLCSARELRIPQKIVLSSSKPTFDLTFARTIVEYASAVYVHNPDELWSWTCDRCNGRTRGFKLVDLIVDVERCLQAFVGVDKSLDAVVVAFRGTQETSMQNWAEDLYFKQLDFKYPGCEDDTLVHHGFYSCYHNTTMRPSITASVLKVLNESNYSKVIVTGHSLGGAMATFAALDLVVNFDIKDVQVMTFGQPRVGNPAFAAYYNTLVPNTIRMTHSHDLVPHLPPYYSFIHDKTYHHVATEVWIYNYMVGIFSYEAYRVCDSTGEDPYCSRSVVGNSVSDHLMYLGVFLKAESVSGLGSS